MFKAVLEKASISTIRIAISGGGPAASVFRMYQELGIDFIQGYGLTETSPIIALNPKEHFKIESVGRFFHPYMEMKILDPDENGIGEVIVKGPMVMQGYYKMEKETAEVFTPDGWFKTGDLGNSIPKTICTLPAAQRTSLLPKAAKTFSPKKSKTHSNFLPT